MSPNKATKKPATGDSGTASERKGAALKGSASSANASSPTSANASSANASSATVSNASASSAAVLMAEPTDDEGKEAKRERAPSAVQALAQELVATSDAQAVLRHAVALEDDRETTANQAARLIQEIADAKPDLLVPLIERFARLLLSKNRKVVASAASALAPLSRIAPAKVAKQLPLLTQNWEHTTEDGKDGLVRTFAGLCTASVAYQKRLEPALARALGEAEPKYLIRWTEIVLPALKGEPHARARAVVEERLPLIPRPQAQKIADFLGIKLRPLTR
jgi:hypothetical protein